MNLVRRNDVVIDDNPLLNEVAVVSLSWVTESAQSYFWRNVLVNGFSLDVIYLDQ